MKHSIPIEEIGPLAEEMADAVTKCVHCGLCLPACPTYKLLNEEMDSPRGRIILMKEVLEGDLDLGQAVPYIDHCLGCLSCQTACPSGVEYGELLTPFRSIAENHRQRPAGERFSRWLAKETLPFPTRFRVATNAGKFARPLSGVLPAQCDAMLDLIPESIPDSTPIPAFYPAVGKPHGRVALLTGCVQQVLAQEINWATLRVLALNGIEVIIPQKQGCCGALALHTGDLASAQELGAHNLSVFPKDIDAVITNAAGCGSCMKEYPRLFYGTELEAQASEFANKVKDISVYLAEIELNSPAPSKSELKIAYHDACHLAHAQRVTHQPRALLEQIPNVSLVSIQEGEFCCGSAGSYNIEQPELATRLGKRKAENILNTGADIVVAGNIGCLIQIRKYIDEILEENGDKASKIPVVHTIEILDRAYQQTL